ncbi:hypothetical protein [Clostridium sp.]|uniref:hypothetical protein n=1 Tax=Clostridium sp. TaxID=1506 RepID=UPI00346476EB
MRIINKKIIMMIMLVLLSIIIAVTTYINHINKKVLKDFSKYIDQYKQEVEMYILIDNEEQYESLIKECEQAIIDSKSKKVEELESKLNTFKAEVLKTNSELASKNISELESIDISELDDKDALLSEIVTIKELVNKNEFVKANKEFISLRDYINNRLLTIKQEKEIQHLRDEEERRKKEADEADRLKKSKEIESNNLSNNENTSNDINRLTRLEIMDLTRKQLGVENENITWGFNQSIPILVKYKPTGELYYILDVNYNGVNFHIINLKTKKTDEISAKYKYSYTRDNLEFEEVS